MLTVGSLFAGIGGFDLGLERAGMSVRWQCEKDPWARKVLAKHWPGVPCYEDITTLEPHAVEYVDVLAGGFPCQDLSVAGKRAGLREGTRSGLWGEFARLIRGIRPKYVLVENVPGLLANHALGRVLGDLAEGGYDAEWQTIPSAAFGTGHFRARVFLLASYSNCQHVNPIKKSKRFKQTSIGIGMHGEILRAKWEIDSCSGRPFIPSRDWVTFNAEPGVGRVAHGVPKRVDRLRGLGNAAVPQVVEWLGRLILTVEANND